MSFTIDLLADHLEFIPIIAGWHYAEWGHEDPAGSAETWAQGLAKRTNRDRIPITYVALDNGFPVGTSELVEQDLSTHVGWSPWLAGVYVLQEYRGKGIGKALVAMAVSMARKLRVNPLYLYTESASGLYEKLGWSEIKKEIFHNQEITIMRIELA